MIAAVAEATLLLKTGLLVDDSIGPYKIVRALGAGAMGQVYLARDERLNRLVAVKLLLNYQAAEKERTKRFRQEALAVSALNHPNILTVYEIGSFAGKDFIATEFVDGVTLGTRIAARDLTITDSLEIVIQIAGALAVAHQAGIIHRDIKPENVMVRADGLVKVLDFGIAKYVQPESEGPARTTKFKTTPGTVVGTASYMSPEQARGLPADTRTDIWSLGVMLYEMVTARRPFQGDTAMDVMAAVLEREPPPLSVAGSVVPESLEQIVFRALEKDREERYQTAAEMLADLKQLAKKLEFASEHEGTVLSNKLLVAEAISPNAEPRNSIAVPLVDTRPESENELPGKATREVSEGRTLFPTPPSTDANNLTQRDRTAAKGPPIQTHRAPAPWLLIGLLSLLIVVAGFFAYRSYTRDTGAQIASIAVLPFANESGNSDLEYLSDGMTDTLINSLSQLPHLSVKARTSVFRYKGKNLEPRQIASELSVQAILNGRVVQHGDELTLFLSLVDARNGNQIWGEQYDRKLSQLVSLQSEIARDVSQKLRARLSGADVQKVTKSYTANPEAYQLYLKGRYHAAKLTLPETKKGISYLRQAIDIDPTYALAYARLSNVYFSPTLTSDVPSSEAMPKAKAAALKAQEIDDSLGEANIALGQIAFWYDWDWEAAERHYNRAQELSPNTDVHSAFAQLFSNTGRHEKAVSEGRRARELDPLTLSKNALEAQVLFYAGRSDEAIERINKTFELDPNFWLAHLVLSRIYIEKRMYPEAIASATKARDFSGGISEATALIGYTLAVSGNRGEARAVLEELKKRSAERYVPPYNIALVYNGLGERNETRHWLEQAYEQRDVRMTFLKVEPKWNNLRADPQFQDLLRRMGFSQ